MFLSTSNGLLECLPNIIIHAHVCMAIVLADRCDEYNIVVV